MKTYEIDEQTILEILDYIEQTELCILHEYEGYATVEQMIEDNRLPDIWKKLKSML